MVKSSTVLQDHQTFHTKSQLHIENMKMITVVLSKMLSKFYLFFGEMNKSLGAINTLGTEMFYPGGFWLETRLIIKILTHPCKPINFDVFS